MNPCYCPEPDVGEKIIHEAQINFCKKCGGLNPKMPEKKVRKVKQ
jgi:hypothetical protein